MNELLYLSGSITTKHKLWLQQLQQQKTVLLKEQEELAEKKARRLQRMKDSSRVLMGFSNTNNQPSSSSSTSLSDSCAPSASVPSSSERPSSPKPESPPVTSQPVSNEPLPLLRTETGEILPCSTAVPKTNSSDTETRNQSLPAHPRKPIKQRPAYALTSEQAEAREEKQEDQELDSLLKFTQELNFESFIDDVEVRTALQAVQDRVKQLNKQITDQEIQIRKGLQQNKNGKKGRDRRRNEWSESKGMRKGKMREIEDMEGLGSRCR